MQVFMFRSISIHNIRERFTVSTLHCCPFLARWRGYRRSYAGLFLLLPDATPEVNADAVAPASEHPGIDPISDFQNYDLANF